MSQKTIQKRRIRRASFLDSSLRLEGIKELLTLVDPQPMYFSELLRKSKIKYKKSFLKYLKYCTDQEFFSNSKVPYRDLPDRYRGSRLSSVDYSFYTITHKGRMFLEMIQ